MDSDFTGPLNLGNPCEFTVKDFANYVIELTSSKSKCVYLPLPQDDPHKRKPDISLAREKIGFEPKYTIEQGIKNTIEYFRNKIS